MSENTVTVTIDDTTASWSEGDFAGDPAIVAAARHAAEHADTVPVFGRLLLRAGASTPFEALAALSASNPGRVFVIEAPEELTRWLDHAFNANCCDHSLTAL